MPDGKEVKELDGVADTADIVDEASTGLECQGWLLLGGDTIHHACGIPVFNGRECHDEDLQNHLKYGIRTYRTA